MLAVADSELDRLLADGDWPAARAVIERQLVADPDNHWLRTQLGVTHYEQRNYREALTHLLASLDILPDCPLTLWNLAGTLDALGEPEAAVRIYVRLLRSRKTADDDPCWESRGWADALKTDCVYRVGICFQHLSRPKPAEFCFRQYIGLLLDGKVGSYPIEAAARHVRLIRRGRPQARALHGRVSISSILKEPQLRAVPSSPRRPSRLLGVGHAKLPATAGRAKRPAANSTSTP